MRPLNIEGKRFVMWKQKLSDLSTGELFLFMYHRTVYMPAEWELTRLLAVFEVLSQREDL